MSTESPKTIYRDGISFEKWMRTVDQILVKKCGLPSDDLPDMLWAQWWEDGLTPRNAVEACLEECSFTDDAEVSDDSRYIDGDD